MRLRILYICIVVLALSGCRHKYEPDQEFWDNADVCLRMDGADYIRYVPETFQLGFSPDNAQFRVNNDTMSEFFILTCSELPVSVGQTVKASLRVGSGKKMYYKSGLEFEVKKVNDDGLVWLWCRRRNIGVTVRVLR